MDKVYRWERLIDGGSLLSVGHCTGLHETFGPQKQEKWKVRGREWSNGSVDHKRSKCVLSRIVIPPMLIKMRWGDMEEQGGLSNSQHFNQRRLR